MGHMQNSTLLRLPNFSCKIETAPLLIFADKLRRVFNFSLLNLEVSLRMGVFQMSLLYIKYNFFNMLFLCFESPFSIKNVWCPIFENARTFFERKIGDIS